MELPSGNQNVAGKSSNSMAAKAGALELSRAPELRLGVYDPELGKAW